MSTLFLRTLRDDPADAEVPSHRLLVRAGYIRRAAPGGFTWLPLGWIVYRNVERIVREEMDARRLPGGPLPGAAAAASRTRRRGAGPTTATTCSACRTAAATTSCMAPTHEEMFTLLVKDLYSLVQGPAAVHLPDPDEVPRRGPAPRRPAARPRVRDEGLLQLRRRRRRPRGVLPAPPRRLHQDVRPPRPAVRDRVGDVGRDGRLGERGVPRPARRRRGHVRAHQVGRPTRPTSRPSGSPPPRRLPYDDAPPARRPRHARHADDRHARRPPQRARRPAPRRPRVDGGATR